MLTFNDFYSGPECIDPPSPFMGIADVINRTTVIYMCEEGFVLIGNQYRTCNFTTWTWTGTDPTCEGIM